MNKNTKKEIEKYAEEIEMYLNSIEERILDEEIDRRTFWINRDVKAVKTYLYYIMNRIREE